MYGSHIHRHVVEQNTEDMTTKRLSCNKEDFKECIYWKVREGEGMVLDQNIEPCSRIYDFPQYTDEVIYLRLLTKN
jgi:hypothetical protein